jgi:hypothetical protein
MGSTRCRPIRRLRLGGVNDFNREDGGFVGHLDLFEAGARPRPCRVGAITGRAGGHLFGGWLSGHLGQMGLLVQSA